jgi:hypothetical protein
MTEGNIAVSVRGVAKSFGGTRILNDIAVDIVPGPCMRLSAKMAPASRAWARLSAATTRLTRARS